MLIDGDFTVEKCFQNVFTKWHERFEIHTHVAVTVTRIISLKINRLNL